MSIVGCGDDGGATPDTVTTDSSGTDATTTDATTAETTSDDDVATEVGPETTGDVGDEVTDTGLLDTGPDVTADTSTDTGPPDTGAPDTTTGVPLPGFGTITGDCGVLDDELTSPEPSFFVTHFDFGTDPYDEDADLDLMTAGAQQIWEDGNAGGSSIRSEMFAFELLARCELATLVKTENQVVYDDPQSKKTDMVLLIDELVIASNPTRAQGFPLDAPYSEAQAKTILEKKLGDINNSTLNVSEADRWVKQILIVFAYADGHATHVRNAWEKLSDELRSDTIVIVTVTDGDDLFIYTE